VTSQILAPKVSAVMPREFAAGVRVLLSLRGAGLSTWALPLHVSLVRSGETCPGVLGQQSGISLDNGAGNVAGLEVTLETAGNVSVCWRVGGDSAVWKLADGGDLVVHKAGIVSSVLPTTLWTDRAQALTLQGVGLGMGLRLKMVSADDACEGSLGGPDENRSTVAGGASIGLVHTSADGQSGLSSPWAIAVAGVVQLCYASAEAPVFQGTGLGILVRAWEAAELIRPLAGMKLDVQRVEAGMSETLPACAANHWSRFLLQPIGNGIDVDTPALLDRGQLYRCYQNASEIPALYPSGVGYRPPGVDARLLEVVRGVPTELVLEGFRLGDAVFVGRTGCGGELGLALGEEAAAASSVPGGEPRVLTEAMRVDVTARTCAGPGSDTPSAATTSAITGSARRYGFAVTVTLTEVSRPGKFHCICRLVLRPGGGGVGDAVGKALQVKVRAPMLLTMEPPFVFSGVSVNYRLSGVGLSPGDRVRLIDGDEPGGCYAAATAAAAAGGGEVVLAADATNARSSVVQFRLERPSHHARVCYQHVGSTAWEEMTPSLPLRAAGYLYGYASTHHFFHGLLGAAQKTANAVGSGNQTVAVLAPVALRLRPSLTVARQRLTLTVDGEGFTAAARFAVVPDYLPCGGAAAPSPNLVQDGTGPIPTHLRAVRGGEPRPPQEAPSDPEAAFALLSHCTGQQQRDACTSVRESESRVSFPAGLSELDLGAARVCFMYDFAAEYKELGQLLIAPPAITAVAPRTGIIINAAFVLTIRGVALRSSDRIKVVDGRSCTGVIASRPYWTPLTVRPLCPLAPPPRTYENKLARLSARWGRGADPCRPLLMALGVAGG